MKTRMTTLIAVLVTVWFGEKLNSAEVPDNMVWIPAGMFQMGDSFSEGNPSERPVHSVFVSGFYMEKTEVSKALWDQVYIWAIDHGYNFLGYSDKYSGKAPDHPVNSITWQNAVKWCNARSEKEGRKPVYSINGSVYRRSSLGELDVVVCNWSENGYRLPTEAEWEKAARGGLSGKRFPWGDTINHSQANYCSNAKYGYDVSVIKGPHPDFMSSGTPFTSPVAYFEANGYGLYDMSGNVFEWCWDWYSNSYYSSSSKIDPRGPTLSTGQYMERLVRGNSWDCGGSHTGLATRGTLGQGVASGSVGFRTVLAATVTNWRQVIETQTVQPTYGICPVKEASENSLVVVTHGRIPKESGQTLPPNPDWVDDMVKAIRKNLDGRGMKNWRVEGYKWKERAWTTRLEVTTKLLDNADAEGVNLGNCLKNQGWKHIHFIGHSAGAAVIEKALKTIKAKDKTVTIHVTFLDAYIGFSYDGRNKYGEEADWADSYYARDLKTDIVLERTSGALKYARNIEITWLANKKTVSVYRSGNGITGNVPCPHTIATHEWAHEFYLKTIPPSTVVGAEGLGFPLSKEADGWDLATKTYPVEENSSYIKVLGRPDTDCLALGANSVPTYSGPRVELDKVNLVPSTTGIIRNNGSGLIITSGGRLQQQSLQSVNRKAQTEQSVAWVAASVIVTNAVNTLSFDAQFLSIKAEGLLTTYGETDSIGSIDERVVTAGLQHYTYALPSTITNGSFTLGFRLDSFSNTVSSIAITNVAFGFIGIREPFSLTVTGTDTNSSPVFSLTGPSGYNYRVESSTNLVDWSTIAILVNTNGVVNFSDPSSTNTNRRFYRAATP